MLFRSTPQCCNYPVKPAMQMRSADPQRRFSIGLLVLAGLCLTAVGSQAETAPNYLETILDELKVVEKNKVDGQAVQRVTTSNRNPAAKAATQKNPLPARQNTKPPAQSAPLKKVERPPAPLPAVQTPKPAQAVKPAARPQAQPKVVKKAPAKTKAATPVAAKKSRPQVRNPVVSKADKAVVVVRKLEKKPPLQATPLPIRDLGALPQFDLAGGEAKAVNQFQESLRTSYPASYHLLRRLPDNEKHVVYQEYRESGDMIRVRKLILQYVRSHW